MRPLSAVPSSAVDPITRAPRFGSYRGSLGTVDYRHFALGRVRRTLSTKRWLYLGIATDDLFVAAAVVDLGYASTTFAYVFDRQAGRNIASASVFGHPFATHVTTALDDRRLADFRLGGTRVSITRDSSHTIALEAKYTDLEIRARFATLDAPAGIVAIAPLPGGLVNTTQKRTLLPVTGDIVVRGRRQSLDGAFGGYDYTNGLLERHTAWKWAFLLGRTNAGAPVALNLVEGFVGEPECAVWLDRDVHGVGEGRIEFDRANPLRPWRIRTADDAVDLRFDARDFHAERKNLGLVRSSFIQAVGSYSGSIRLAGQPPIEIGHALGVAEDQDVLW